MLAATECALHGVASLGATHLDTRGDSDGSVVRSTAPAGRGDLSTLPWELVTPKALEEEERAYNLDLIERTFGGRIGRPRCAPNETMWKLLVIDRHQCSRTRAGLGCDEEESDWDYRTIWKMREVPPDHPLLHKPAPEDPPPQDHSDASHFCWREKGTDELESGEDVTESVLSAIRGLAHVTLARCRPSISRPRPWGGKERGKRDKDVGEKEGKEEKGAHGGDDLFLDPKQTWLVTQVTRIDGMRSLDVAPVLPEECMVQLPRLEYVAERLHGISYGGSQCCEYFSTLWHSVNAQVIMLRRFLQTRSFYLKDVAPWMRAEIDARSPLPDDPSEEHADGNGGAKRKKGFECAEGCKRKRLYKRQKRADRRKAEARRRDEEMRAGRDKHLAERAKLVEESRIREGEIRELQRRLKGKQAFQDMVAAILESYQLQSEARHEDESRRSGKESETVERTGEPGEARSGNQ